MFKPLLDCARYIWTALFLISTLLLSPAAAQEKPTDTTPASPAAPEPSLTPDAGNVQTGLAAYYSDRLHGHRTASGQRYNRNEMTTAHQTLPFGTRVKVTSVKTNQSVLLRVNDRGPTQAGRIVDVSHAAAQRLGMLRSGLDEVKVEVVK